MKALVPAAVLAALLCRPAAGRDQPNQFGGQSRADAAHEMIVLAVQQGIDSLPPMSAQAFTYEYDPESDTYVRGKLLGPTSFRTPQTIGAGTFSVRLATSYFGLGESFGPIPYLIDINKPLPGQPPELVALLGLTASAKVGLINLAASYGITNRVEAWINLPIVIVDAQASQVFSSSRTGLSLPPYKAKLVGAPVVDNDVAGALHTLDHLLRPGGPAVLREETFSDLRLEFNDGTHSGVGRIDIGAKGLLYSDKHLQLAIAPEFFFPSPSQEQFAGPDSAAILPRVVAGVPIVDRLKLHIDVGYNYDFTHDELRSFVWNVGASVPGSTFTVDFGFGGAKFNQGITWTPPVARSITTSEFAGSTDTALGDVTLGDNFANFLAGFKYRIFDGLVLSGSVTVPINNEGFRPAAIGTLAVEYYLPTS